MTTNWNTHIVRQVASEILRRGVELRFYKLFPNLNFYSNFNPSPKIPFKMNF